MTDVYANWRERLANSLLPKPQQKKMPTYDGHVDVGFYRKRETKKAAGGASRTTRYVPVAFWMEGGELVGVAGGRNLNTDQCKEMWLWVCANPISEETYRAVSERGESWPDQHAPKAKRDPEAEAALERAFIAEDDRRNAADAVIIASNGPTLAEQVKSELMDPSAEIIAEGEKLKPDAGQYAKIESDEQSARANDWSAQLTAAVGRLDKHREALVRPHLDEQQRINRKFNPIIQEWKALADKTKRAQADWELTKREAQREAERRAEAERQRIIAEQAEAARKAAEAGKPALEPAPAPVVEAKSNAPAPSEQIKGATGRAANVKEVFIAIVEDQDAAYQAMKANPVIIEAIRKVAQARLDAGISTPGVSAKADVKIR